MLEALERLMHSFGTTLLACTLMFCLMLGASVGFRYFEVYTINSNIENLMSDLLDYAAMHNGFNDPGKGGGYSFNQVKEEHIARYQLQEYIADMQFNPAVGTQAGDRTSEIYITVTPKFPSLNPFSRDLRIGKQKDSRSLTHGYVKVTGRDKSTVIDTTITEFK